MTITHKGHPLFLWTNSSLTLGCPAGLSSSLMCSPRPPAVAASAPAVAATASRPATHPPRRLCRCRQDAPASSVLPATSQLPRRPDQQLPDGAPPRRLGQQLHHARLGQSSPAPRLVFSRWRSATAPRPAAPPPRHPSQQHLRHGASAVALSAPAGSCFPMLPHCLPCRDPRGAATFPHRLPLRSIPPAALRLRAPSHSRGAWAPAVCAEEFPTPREMPVH